MNWAVGDVVQTGGTQHADTECMKNEVGDAAAIADW